MSFLRTKPRAQTYKRQTRPSLTLRVEQLEDRSLLATALYYNPLQIAAAYGFPTTYQGKLPGTGETIAIVDAYNSRTILKDIAQFNAHVNDAYGSWPGGDPVPAINLTVLNQAGVAINPATTTSPQSNSSWALEIALDVEWAHAMAPGAKIVLVEANSSAFSDLLAGVKTAAKYPNVSVVSMSWGSSEFAGEKNYDSYFTTPTGHTPVTFVAAAGDNGNQSWPAVSPKVIGVGGTLLHLTSFSDTGVWQSETAWGGSGGGVSAYESLPGYQSGLGTKNGASTTRRNTPDVSYFSGNSSTYFWVYSGGAWTGVYGTSAGAPQWSALIAIANQGLTTTLNGPTQVLPALYKNAADFHDITTGHNLKGTAGTGYDLVTGLGTPFAGRIIADLAALGTTASSAANSSTTSPTHSGTTVIVQLVQIAPPERLLFIVTLDVGVFVLPPSRQNVSQSLPLSQPVTVLPQPQAHPLPCIGSPLRETENDDSETDTRDGQQVSPIPTLAPAPTVQAIVNTSMDVRVLEGVFREGELLPAATMPEPQLPIGSTPPLTSSAREIESPSAKALLFVLFGIAHSRMQLTDEEKRKRAGGVPR